MSNGDTLNPGDTLTVGGSINSQNDEFTLILQDDGNLVLYDDYPSGQAAATDPIRMYL